MTFSSAGDAIMSSLVGGLAGSFVPLPLAGLVTSDDYTSESTLGTTIGLASGRAAAAAQPLPRATTLTGMAATFTLGQAMSLVDTTITPQAQLWVAEPGSITASPVSGAVCVLNGLTGLLSVGTHATCTTSGLAIPLSAGSRAFVVVSISAAGMSMVNTITGQVSASLALS